MVGMRTPVLPAYKYVLKLCLATHTHTTHNTQHKTHPSHQSNSAEFLCMDMCETSSYKQDGGRKKAVLFASLLFLSIVSVVSTSTTLPCKGTLYPEVCESLIPSGGTSTTSGDMFGLSVKFVVDEARLIRSLSHNISRTIQNPNNNLPSTLDDCVELLDHSLYQLGKILDDSIRATLSSEDIQTWLSTAITHQTTCSETLQNHKFSQNDVIDVKLRNNIKHISNSLALHKTIVTSEATALKGSGGRKLLSDEFPTWVSTKERKLLEASVEDLKPNAVVAVDGTGTHKTIAEAIAFASLAGSGRTVIHVKAGTYTESNLNVPLKKSNVMLVGDGKGKTVVTGSKSNGGGSTTFSSATLGVSGDGFMARDITFVNSAGPAAHQAVALRVTSDRSVFYRCSIMGYQDTLYTLSNRQFYRETDIYGTVDFIFGNSAVVFQSCNISPRKGSSTNFITAQGRTDPNQNTGISIHKCRISATSDLQSAKVPTYLGRPWQKYSTTVIMQSYIDGSINPAGWFPWSGNSHLDTLYYAEYMNSGPGAATSGRVKWPGYHASITSADASKFTVSSLISGNSWLPSTGVVFEAGL